VFAPLAYGHKELAETAMSGHTGNRFDWVSGLLIVVSSELRFLRETVTSILCAVWLSIGQKHFGKELAPEIFEVSLLRWNLSSLEII
jgi:hypothetical protein